MRSRTSVLWCCLLAGCATGKDLVLVVPTGDTGPTPTTATGLAIAGTYTDAFGTEHAIDEAAWVQTYPGSSPWTFEIATYDNAGEVLIAQNGADNPYSAGLWSRFDWTWPDHLHYCQTAYDAASQADAEGTPRADTADLAAGCGGFPWTDLTP